MHSSASASRLPAFRSTLRRSAACASVLLLLTACSSDDDDDLVFGALYDGYDNTDVEVVVLQPLTLTPQAVDPDVISFTVTPALPPSRPVWRWTR